MGKHDMLCVYKGILLCHKREAVLVPGIKWMNPSTLCKVKEARRCEDMQGEDGHMTGVMHLQAKVW